MPRVVIVVCPKCLAPECHCTVTEEEDLHGSCRKCGFMGDVTADVIAANSAMFDGCPGTLTQEERRDVAELMTDRWRKWAEEASDGLD